MTVSEFASNQALSVLAMPEPEREICGGYVGDLLSWVMGRARSGNAWITIMTNINVVAVAGLADVSCVLLAEGVVPDAEVVAKAKEKGVNLLSSSLPAYEIVAMLSGLGI